MGNNRDYAYHGISTLVTDMALFTKKSVSSTTGPFVSFNHPFRKLGLIMCGWCKEDEVEELLKGLEGKGEFEKAAGMALFYLSSFERAIGALNASKSE